MKQTVVLNKRFFDTFGNSTRIEDGKRGLMRHMRLVEIPEGEEHVAAHLARTNSDFRDLALYVTLVRKVDGQRQIANYNNEEIPGEEGFELPLGIKFGFDESDWAVFTEKFNVDAMINNGVFYALKDTPMVGRTATWYSSMMAVLENHAELGELNKLFITIAVFIPEDVDIGLNWYDMDKVPGGLHSIDRQTIPDDF